MSKHKYFIKMPIFKNTKLTFFFATVFLYGQAFGQFIQIAQAVFGGVSAVFATLDVYNQFFGSEESDISVKVALAEYYSNVPYNSDLPIVDLLDSNENSVGRSPVDTNDNWRGYSSAMTTFDNVPTWLKCPLVIWRHLLIWLI
jgi:hypothetical protein